MNALVMGTVIGVETRAWPSGEGSTTEVLMELPQFGQKAAEQFAFEVGKDFVQQAQRLAPGARIVADVKVTSKPWKRGDKSGRLNSVFAFRFWPIATAEAHTASRRLSSSDYGDEPF